MTMPIVSNTQPRESVTAFFPHESHLDATRWPQLTERGRLVRGWVSRGQQVKAVSGRWTHHTYITPTLAAPTPTGSSWSNLDLCGGWRRDWMCPEGLTNEDWVILHRVVSGDKLCGAFLARTPSDSPSNFSRLDLATVRTIVDAHVDFQLVETPFLNRDGQPWTLQDGTVVTDVVRCWIAPRATLGSACDVDEVARWYEAIGLEGEADALVDAASTYLPDLANRFDAQAPAGPASFAITGLVLGYPPGSTASLNLW